MSVTLVITEHSGALPPETLVHYEVVRERLERAAGAPVTTVQYEEVGSLGGADAVVLSGSFAPWADHTPAAIDQLGDAVRSYNGPVLGICAGMQLQTRFAGGTIRPSPARPETGFSAVEVVQRDGLLRGLPSRIEVYQHHSDEIEELPESFRVLARSATCAIEAIADPGRRWWGTQFHPEEFDVAHPVGERILRNFFELARDFVSLSELEQRIVDEIGRRGGELVELASALIHFDTEAREPDDPPREEAALQEYLSGRLAALGAEIDLWEPACEDIEGSRLVPAGGLGFEGRPQLAARFRGAGGGRSLLLNGHVDVVSPAPREAWTSDPNKPEVRDGKLYGRGSCDMKGGIAAMTFAAEVLAELGLRLAGDLVVCTVTDEESTGAGGLAAVAHGVRADAGIVTEPSGFDVWTSCRGSLMPTITVPGRPGHAGVGQPDWWQGGAVNSIEKATLIIDALRGLKEEWRERPDQQHPHLSPGDIVPTIVSGGEWIVSYPASCRIAYHVAYLPAHADEGGWGRAVAEEIVERVRRAAAADPWLAENPPVIEWATDVPSSEVSEAEPIVQAILGVGSDIGRPRRISGMDSWHDGATFTRFGDTPCVCFGPRDLMVAHTIDEYVVVDDLVEVAQELAIAAIRFCGLG